MGKIEGINLPLPLLSRLMPMHAIISETGHICHAGPTLEKLHPETGLTGTRFLEKFEMRRPRNVTRISELCAKEGTALSLRLRARPDVPLKGFAAPLPDGGRLLVNLSFGIAAVEAVGIFDLSSGDFSPTDLTVEMLYLVEAKDAVMSESRDLNLRLQGAKIAAEEQAYTDTLTGLKNRRAMDKILGRYAKGRESFGLMHLDLDFFKEVNDTLGHAAGDHVLQETARILVNETRVEDMAVRFGGDEFVLLFHGITDPARLDKIARRILERLQKPIVFQDTPCHISGSIGIAMSDDYEKVDPDQMLFDADMALYASKHSGRARHTFVRDMNSAHREVAASEAIARQ